MLVDLAPVAQSAADVLSVLQAPDLSQLKIDLSSLITAFAVLGAIYAVWTYVLAPMRTAIFDTITQNWQLGLLGATGLVLSLASGWTTWDGMRNFTQEPLLSLMITFGIQGVMLIVAWLIGESFATGMSHRPMQAAPVPLRRVSGRLREREPETPRLGFAPGVTGNIMGTLIGVLVFGLLAVVVLRSFGAEEAGLIEAGALSGISNSLLFAGAFLLVLAVILFGAGEAVWSNYAQAGRIMIRSAVLWVMFLACMATSVFFSFDSLFSTIFPAQERQRAAELRAQNQVAGIVNDIGTVAVKRRIREQEALFQSEAWTNYAELGNAQSALTKVITVAEVAPEKIRAQIRAEIEAQRRKVAELQEKQASAVSGQAGLETRKRQLTEALSRAQAERPETATKVNEFKTVVDGIERRLDEQRAVMLAEERGVEGSGKAGRGPMWRAARAAFARISAELEVAKKRLAGHADRLSGLDKSIANYKAELAQIDGDLARLRGEADTAEQLIDVAQSSDASVKVVRVDPSSGIAALQKAVLVFRQTPTPENLASVQARCQSLKNAALKVADLQAAANGIDCDPGFVTEAAADVFALNVGIKSLEANCIGGDKLPQTGGTDGLFQFARKCVQDSGLPSDATDRLRQSINLAELNRDDKAHRFVVTVNAFGDGNKLAYLALAIAIAIDSLVFMSGLFGANATRSPLSDVPSHKGRSAQQLEAIVDHALQPETFENATMTLERLQPVPRDPRYDDHDGWTHEVTLPPLHTAERARVQKVLSAGGTIGAVIRDPHDPNQFRVRGELVEYLAIVAKKAFENDHEKVRLAELKKILVVALQPHVGDHAEIVLGYLRPISGRDGFSCEVCIQRDIGDISDRFIVQKAINAGTTLDFVQKDDRPGEEHRFYLHRDFYRTLATVAAEFPKTGERILHPQLARDNGAQAAAAASLAGGALHDRTEQVTTHVGHERQIADETHRRGTRQEPAQPEPLDMRGDFRVQFLKALPYGGEDQYLWANQNPGLATSAEGLFEQIVRNKSILRPRLEDAMADAEEALARVYGRLMLQYESHPELADQLKTVRHEISDLLPLLMLAPRGSYHALIQQAIEELEAAAGRDDGLRPHEALTLNRLREHVAAVIAPKSPAAAINAIKSFVHQRSPEDDGKVAKFPSKTA